jgi:hypothetical protein
VDDEDSRKREDSNFIRSMNAMISFFLHIPFPERLDDDTWMEKVRQIQWLSEKGLLGVKTNGKG